MSKSGLITITLFAILMIWDGYAVYFTGVQSSVSQWIIGWLGFNPIGFYAGTIVGHLVCNMWPDTTRLKNAWAAASPLILSTPQNALDICELGSSIDQLVGSQRSGVSNIWQVIQRWWKKS